MAKRSETKEKAMASAKSWLFLLLSSFPFLFSVAASSLHERESVGRRVLMSFKETPEGTNVTFECSRSGSCDRCLYSEKVDEKYRCSETGYRIPFKCVEVQDATNGENTQKSQKDRSTFEISDSSANAIKQRNLRDDSSTADGESQAYITYRSCIPPVDEEGLSVIGFEVLYFGMVSSILIWINYLFSCLNDFAKN
ncbi:hypothetical protein SLEP1_g25297 [Rubroshorea leprosula]|uniref:Uncharacterized protein n=1 Tax=Rubroshorea leprosula TaxID=152421 RepID=A0AAV5JLI4_9ROSI|nr:hypothetical protein SLEP1_g25297 [Rubroshorea leprosula]